MSLNTLSGNHHVNEHVIEEQIFRELLRQAESKMNERRKRLVDLNYIVKRVNEVLYPQINVKLRVIKDIEFKKYEATETNIKYGLANTELKFLADGYSNLKQMNKIIEFTTDSKMS